MVCRILVAKILRLGATDVVVGFRLNQVKGRAKVGVQSRAPVVGLQTQRSVPSEC
jgi:hypothetical protein